MSLMKSIEYHGGLVKFRVPEHWIEAQEDEITTVLYQMGLDTGNLRVMVRVFPPPFPRELPSAYELVHSRAAKLDGTAEALPNGNAVLRYVAEMVEEGKEITQYFWDVAHIVPPERARVAMFCYTVLKSQVEDPAIVADLEMLHAEIRDCEFGDG
jgi:hypothetical protein